MKFLEGKIILEKEMNELDKLVFSFANILSKYTDYVVVSGYVAIILGRMRGTDDVDVLITEKDRFEFENLINKVFNAGYWCINTHDTKEMYDLLKTGHSIRIAKNEEISPNFEIKFAKAESDFEALNNFIEIYIKNESIRVAPLELQIAYKEVVLKADKDMEDAKHIRVVLEEYIDEEKINEYKKRLMQWMQKR